MELLIKQADNGFIIESEDGNTLVYEEGDSIDEYEEHRALVYALHGIIETFGLQGSKHDRRKIKCYLDGGDDQ